MTPITVIDRPCGVGKTSELIAHLQSLKANGTTQKFLIVVPVLTEITRFIDALDGWLETIDVDPTFGLNNKTDALIDCLEMGKSVVITHALYERIYKFKHLLHRYDVIIDEVPNVAKQVPTTFGRGTFNNLLHDKGYIEINPITKLITATSKWLIDELDFNEGTDKGIKQFMDKVINSDVYYVSGTYCLMPLPDAFFTEPKSLTILTFLFTGTQLERYMISRGYEFYLEVHEGELQTFKQELNKNLLVCNETIKCKTGYDAMSGKVPKNRELVGKYVRRVIDKTNKDLELISPSSILVASHKDAWFGTEDKASSKVTNFTRLKRLTRLTNAEYTALITRGTNKFKHLNALVMLGGLYIHPSLAEFLGMRTKKAKDLYATSELIQLLYRTSIRDKKKTYFISPDKRNIDLLKAFINS